MPKKLLAAVLAAVMCVSLSGCAQKNSEINESNIESSKSEQEKLKVLDEIKNADFTSGKIQIFNEIFEPFGTMTVDEFVEKYKDDFYITYKDGEYEERKDYLLEYGKNDGYYLKLFPKNTNVMLSNRADYALIAIANITSPDKKITIDKGVVVDINRGGTPLFATPGGFISRAFADKMREDDRNFVNPNASYTLDSFCEYLKSNGFEECQWKQTRLKSAEDKYYYITGGGVHSITVICCSKKRIDGKTPVLEYVFFYNTDTDKIETADFSNVTYYSDEDFANQ